MDDEIVDVKYVKSEDNVLDICTKHLPAKLFKKHLDKLVSDVGFFTRCNTRLMGKAGTWRDTDWAKRERLEEFAQPMGRIRKQYRLGYTITKLILDYKRLDCFHKRLHGPLQRDSFWRRRDRTGSFVVPPNQKKHVIAKYLNSFGETVKIYDTDHA